MAFNLGSAAAAAGVNKSTILRAVKAGRISAERDATGQWAIQPAELFRVFPPLPAAATDVQAPTQRDASADELVAELKAVIADLREDRDHWRQAFESTQRLLSAPTPQRATWLPRWIRRAG